jgi:hypothetical protein
MRSRGERGESSKFKVQSSKFKVQSSKLRECGKGEKRDGGRGIGLRAKESQRGVTHQVYLCINVPFNFLNPFPLPPLTFPQ